MAQSNPDPQHRLITLRYHGRCRYCGAQLMTGQQAFHLSAKKAVICLACEGRPAATIPRPDAPVAPVAPIASEPGGSAIRQYEKKRQARKDHATAAFGQLGKIATKVLPEPQTQKNWKTGGKGEQEAAARLSKLLAGTNVLFLHDRRIPGKVSNIDHIAIGPGGVTVIDTKNWNGKARVRKSGFGKRAREEFVVDGRDRTKSIDGVIKQIEVVESALQSIAPPIEVEVLGAIYWWKYEGLPLFGEVRVKDIPVFAGKQMAKLAARPGDLDEPRIRLIHKHLAAALPPA